MSDPVRVLAFGWYGAGNVGDELLLGTLKQWCVEKEAQVTALSMNPTHTRHLHQIDAVDAYDLQAVASAMQQADLFVLGGGGLFQTHHAFTISALYSYSPGDISAYARPVLMARQMGIPTLLWAQGVGPLDGDDARQIVRDIFANATHASVRDEGSRALLSEIGVDRELVIAPDPVWAYPVPANDQPKSATAGRLALVLRPWPVVSGWEDAFIEALEAAVSPDEYTLVWVPFQSVDVPQRSGSDIPFIGSLMQRLGKAYRHEMVDLHDPADVVKVLGSCEKVVSMRLHAQILSLKLGKPTLCVEYDEKMSAVSEMAGVPAGLRLAVDSPKEIWASKFKAWMGSGGATADVAIKGLERLSSSALRHREVIHAAIEGSSERLQDKHWRAQDFDWLRAWRDGLLHADVIARDGQIAALHQVLSQRDENMSNAVRTISERDSEVASLKRYLSEREQSISEQSLRIASLEQVSEERSSRIASLEQVSEERNLRIASLEQVSEERRTRLTSLQQSLDERDSRIGLQQQALDEQGAQISSLQQSVAERSSLVAGLRSELSTHQEAMRNLDSRAKELQSQLDLGEQELRTASNANETLLRDRAELARREALLKSELGAIQASLSWRMTHPVRFLRALFVLPGAERQKLIYSAARSSYWSLPEPLRHGLKRLRHRVVSKHRQSQPHDAPALPAPELSYAFDWVDLANAAAKIAIVPSAFEFDELANQRPINLAKYLAANGFTVIFAAWQWSRGELLNKSGTQVHPGVWQVDLYDMLDRASSLDTRKEKDSMYFITLPAPNLVLVQRDLRQRGLSISYDIMDEWEEFARVGQAPWFSSGAEREAVLLADAVTAVSPPLARKFADLRGDIKVVGNGYSPSILGGEQHLLCARKARQAGAPVRIGYFGHLTDAWFDWNIVLSAARQMPEATFEIIGYGEPEWVHAAAAKVPNLHLLGKVQPSELWRHTQFWHVALAPFIPGPLATAIDPIKVYEYLYFGLPVVCTGIPHLSSFPSVQVVDGPDSFVQACLELSQATPDYEAMQESLAHSTWQARFDALLNALHSNGLRSLYAT